MELQRRLNAQDGLYVDKKMELYGLDFFNTFQTSFMPINEPNPDSGYILDVGDILEIQLVGQNSSIKEFQKLDSVAESPKILPIENFTAD